MMTIFSELNDYRDFLKSYYEQRKKEMPFYSYRMMGDKLGLDSSFLYRVIQKKQHLPIHVLPTVKELLGIYGRSAEYFDLLVAAGVIKNSDKKSELLAKAVALRDVERRSLQIAELKFLENRWISAVRAYLELNGGIVNIKKIASELNPPITEEQAAEAIEILKEVGLVKSISSGRLVPTESHLTVSGAEKAKAVRHFQKQVLFLASEALENIPVKERDISTLTLSVDEACFEDIGEMLKEFRRLVQKRVDESKHSDRVMQLSMAFYPVTKTSEKVG